MEASLLRPLKKQKPSCASPLRNSDSNSNIIDSKSRWVTPSLHETNKYQTSEFTSSSSVSIELLHTFLPPSPNRQEKERNENSTVEKKKSIQPLSSQKENLPNCTIGIRSIKALEIKNRAQLQAILQRNGQSVTGSVKILRERIVDGQIHGILGYCPKCQGGKLKLALDSKAVYCSRKMHCGFTCLAHNAPRSGPWIWESLDAGGAVVNASGPAAKAATDTATTTTNSTKTGEEEHRKEAEITKQESLKNKKPAPHIRAATWPPALYWNYGQEAQSIGCHSPLLQQYSPQFPPHFFYAQDPYYNFRPPLYRPPLHLLQYNPSPMPYDPPNNFRIPLSKRTTIIPAAPTANWKRTREDTFKTEENQRFPLSTDPVYFPEKKIAPTFLGTTPFTIPRDDCPLQKQRILCDHSPEELAMATKAAKRALGGNGQTVQNKSFNAKQSWTVKEDAVVQSAITSSHSANSFNAWTSLVPFLPGRTGKQIRDRWVNHLNPSLIHIPFSREDDMKLWNGYLAIGKSWKVISQRCFRSKRSENKIKNRWHSGPFQKFIAQTVNGKDYEQAFPTKSSSAT